jgi:hypothetical protein
MHPSDANDIAALRAEVSQLRTEIGSARATRPARRLPRMHRLRRSTSVIALVGLMIALPMAVSASHQFTDVPTSNTFHANIGNLFDARITTGCTPTTYCPDANVSRGQMAGFLNRGLGRGAGISEEVLDDDWAGLSDGVVQSLTVRAGGVSGGYASLLATGTLNPWTDENGICPCEVAIALVNPATGETSAFHYSTITGVVAPSTFYQESVAVTHLFTVPSGANTTIELQVALTPTLIPSPENNAGYAYSLNAVYLPFDGTGNAVLPPVTTSGQEHRNDR